MEFVPVALILRVALAYFNGVSLTEILEELPKLTEQERELLFLKLEDLLHPNLDSAGEGEESPELLAVIDEADRSPVHLDLNIEQMRDRLAKWVKTIG